MDGFTSILIFFKILFFGETILLTPIPIDVVHRYKLHLKEPISALTSGAHFRISILNKNKDYSYPKIYDTVPPQSITIELYDINDTKTIFKFERGVYGSKNEQGILLYSKNIDLSKNYKYNKLILYTTVELKDIKIKWSNFKK